MSDDEWECINDKYHKDDQSVNETQYGIRENTSDKEKGAAVDNSNEQE